MKRLLSSLALVALALTACAPAAQAPTEAATSPAPTASPAALPPVAEAAPTVTKAALSGGETLPAPQATSRGDALFASDPASVSLDNGKPVLVEFFRFT